MYGSFGPFRALELVYAAFDNMIDDPEYWTVNTNSNTLYHIDYRKGTNACLGFGLWKYHGELGFQSQG